ncbi:hypothetical protein ACH3Y9_02150 [Streptomyces sp. WSLK1-5]|uniref:hypothetical protein n=1 Tax=unclassified Streptomyces TaxID=2593676 RepID=UPI003787D3FF
MAPQGAVVREECADGARDAFVVIAHAVGRPSRRRYRVRPWPCVKNFLGRVSPVGPRDLAEISEWVVGAPDKSPAG